MMYVDADTCTYGTLKKKQKSFKRNSFNLLLEALFFLQSQTFLLRFLDRELLQFDAQGFLQLDVLQLKID